MQGSADAKNIEMVLNLPAKMPQLRGDKERLAVVFTNLVGNAIKYTPQGGRVDVRCAADAGRLRVAIADTGYGIKSEDQEKIFGDLDSLDDDPFKSVPAAPVAGRARAGETQ